MADIHIVGELQVRAGRSTEPEYSFSFTPDDRCVVMEFHADWLLLPADEDIEMFLYGKRRPLGMPATNYSLFYGPNASGIAPLSHLFDLRDYRKRRTLAQFDPIPAMGGLPLFTKGEAFQVKLHGTPFVANSDFGLRFSIETRPFNS